jgi:ribosome-binding ATPase
VQIGFIGKRLSGKTTLFDAISSDSGQGSVQGGLINVSNVKVKDKNIYELSKIFNPKKTTYAEVNVLDYLREKDASNNTLGSNALIAKYRELDALGIVVGIINNISEIKKEVSEVFSELYLQDIVVLESKIERMKKTKHDEKELKLYEGIVKKLESNENLNINMFSKEELKILSSYGLFSLKPVIFILNVSENLISKENEIKLDKPFTLISAEIEKEITSLPMEERKSFMEEMGIKESAKDKFIAKLYETMNLISFYTVGEDEVRAWPIKKDSTALEAAGKIHSDIERGFIRAATINFTEFMKYKNENKAKEDGVVRNEGKEYVVKHGDIIHFKFNV